MTGYTISKVLTVGVLVAMCCQLAVAAPRVKRDDIDGDEFVLSPVEVADQPREASRDKRKVTETFAAKNAILGYVFGASSNALRPPVTTKAPPISTTTDDTPDFDRAKVSLDVPDGLFSTSFSTVTNISKAFGELMMNSARRYAQFVQYFKPVLGATLTIKGLDVRPTIKTTTEYISLGLEEE